MECVMENLKVYNERLKDKLRDIVSLIAEININTEYAAFFRISGHVGTFDASVSISKEQYNDKIFSVDMYPYSVTEPDYVDDKDIDFALEDEFKSVSAALDEIILKLSRFLTEDFTFITEKSFESVELGDGVLVNDGGTYKYIIVYSIGSDHVYDAAGERYDKIYIRVGK
jgi:hypothetical protein